MLSFSLLSLFLSFCALSLVLAQNGSVFQTEAVKAHFNQSGLVPAVLKTLNPTALLSVSFKGLTGSIALGQRVTREQTLLEPSLWLTSANISVPLSGAYTFMMFDAGHPGADQSHGQRRHWLVNNATILASSHSDFSMVGATTVTRYIPPNPPLGNGPHRYVFLVFTQPADFLPPANLFRENTGGGIFSVESYAKYSRLGPIVAASYFTCQRGPTTASLAPTSPVVSATLPGWTGAVQPTGGKANSGLSATHNLLALFLAPIMGVLAM